ncbi:DUF4097 family beta strand repeat-containing protein [Solimonas marina]|uniref:DUF4097 family beta strand repeat protein n=1 Tax=Solimonas marina TaxID=2714601 RepID=A0A970B7F0_9GAMM|nr:DUF4097 family beta strand repeat-containing protein [Solimonas marina]NKF23828.1 DUF4097 family beta strand repeat protein [Solimonas marina]
MKTLHTFSVAAALLAASISGAVYASTPIDETRPLAADGKLSVTNTAGSIVVKGWDRNEVKLSGKLGDDVEKLDISGDAQSLQVVVRYPKNHHGSIDDTELTLNVPTRATLDLNGVSADIKVNEVGGPLTAKSVSGDVTLAVSSAQIKASSVSGDVNVQGPSYSADVHSPSFKTTLNSVSGDLKAKGLRGELTAETVSGNLSLQGGSFKTLKLQSVSGDLDLKLGLDKGAQLSAETLSGDIELRFDKTPDAKLTMKTFSGDLRNRYSDDDNDDDRHSLSTTLGSGDGRIDLHSFSGDIEVGSQN